MFSVAYPSYELLHFSPDQRAETPSSADNPFRNCLRTSSRHPRPGRWRASRQRSPLHAQRHRNAHPSRPSFTHDTTRTFYHPSRLAARLCARNRGARRQTPPRTCPPQAANYLSPPRNANGADPRPGRLPAWCWGPPCRGWLSARLCKVSPSTAISPRALCTWDGASRADAQVRVQVADAGEFVVGRSAAALEGL